MFTIYFGCSGRNIKNIKNKMNADRCYWIDQTVVSPASLSVMCQAES